MFNNVNVLPLWKESRKMVAELEFVDSSEFLSGATGAETIKAKN